MWAKHWSPCTHQGEPVHNGLHEGPPDVRILPLPFLDQWRWCGWSRPRPWSSTTIHETSAATRRKVWAPGQFLRTSGPSSCLHSNILLQGVVEGLLPIGKLKDDIIPVSHWC